MLKHCRPDNLARGHLSLLHRVRLMCGLLRCRHVSEGPGFASCVGCCGVDMYQKAPGSPPVRVAVVWTWCGHVSEGPGLESCMGCCGVDMYRKAPGWSPVWVAGVWTCIGRPGFASCMGWLLWCRHVSEGPGFAPCMGCCGVDMYQKVLGSPPVWVATV